MTPPENDFLHLAQRYILAGKPQHAWRAAVMAARIAQARHDLWKQAACDNVVAILETMN